MSSPNLAISHVAASQNQKEVTINDAIDRLDEAISGRLVLDFTVGEVTLTEAQLRRHVAFATTGMAEGRGLMAPPIRRLFLVDNAASAHALAVRCGSTTVLVEAGAVQLLHTTGTTDGLVAAAPPSLVAGAVPFDIVLYLPGNPEAAERLLKLEVARAFAIPENLAGSRGHADAAATAAAVLSLRHNGTAVGTITFAAGSQDAAFALAGGLALLPGHRLELDAPAVQDATLAGLAFTFLGYRS